MNKKLLVLFAATAIALTGCNTNSGKKDDGGDDTPVEVDTKKAISFVGNDIAFATGLPEKADKDEKISFKVLALSGYEITEVEVTDANDAEVTLSGSINEGFTFTMPDSEVKIITSAQGAYFHLDMADSTKVVITPENYEYGAKTVKNFIGGYIIDKSDKIQSGDYVYARAGQEVSILVNAVGFAKDVDVLVNGVSATKENYIIYNEAAEGEEATIKYEYNAYKFIMPNTNASIDVTASEKTIKVVAEENDKLNSKIYKLVDGTKVYTNDFHAGEIAYADVSLKAEYADSYLISGGSYKYGYNSGYDAKVSNTETTFTTYKTDSGVTTFSANVTSYTAYATDITITTKLQELKYKGKEFIGSYLGYEFYRSSFPYSAYSSKSVTIDEAGNVKIGTTKLTIDDTKVDETNKTIGTLNSSNNSERTIHYDGKLLWVSDSSYDKTEETDVWVCVKDATNWTNITVTKNSDANMNSGYLAFVELTDSTTNEVIGNFLKADGVIYLNVTLKNGETTLAPADVTNASSFDIYKGDSKVASHTGA